MKLLRYFVTLLLCSCAIGFVRTPLQHALQQSRLIALRVTSGTNVRQVDSDAEVQPVIPSLKGVPYRINEIVRPSEIEAVRFRHIAVATEELANECRSLLVQQKADFDALVATLSLCTMTKDKGGDAGWHSTKGEESDTDVGNLHQSSSIPPELVNAACYLKKGDMVVVSSRGLDGGAAGWHVLQLMDVQMKLAPQLAKRRQENFLALKRGHSLTYSMETMGCQMNVADSERMEGQLRDLGYTRVENSNEANLVILNTCSIRDNAEQKVYSHIGPHALRKRRGEDVSIVVAGCVAQQEGAALAKRFPELDIVMGPQYANRISDLLESVAEGNQVISTDPAYQTEDTVRARRRSEVVAFVNVIYGCNERCTYCVVPNTRGVEQSRTKEAILAEMAELAALGYKEVTLLGQNVDSWGRDMNPKQRFADLLTAAGQVEGIERVRFLTSHPKYMSERVVRAVAENPKLMPCFNVPFQSGNNEVLRNMRRGYTRERFLEIVQSIRSLLPDAAITADCIVGFPGETEEQFQETLSLMEEVKFEQVNTAAYSPRPNTPAAEWTNQLPDEVKQDRLQRINRLGTEHALERSRRFVGRVMDVLVEDINVKNPTQVMGRIPHSRLTYFEGNIAALAGKIVKVRITEAKPFYLLGELVI